MLCEECGKNQATVSITVSAGGEITTRRLCPECMKKMKLSLVSGDIQGFLSSVLSVLGSAQKPQEHAAVCSGCGLSYDEFERTGRLGCAQCYRDFSDQLKPLLQRIHGRTQHAGRRPAAYTPSPEDERAALASELRQKMDEAVASENFEDAAKYRDELRKLNEGSDAAVNVVVSGRVRLARNYFDLPFLNWNRPENARLCIERAQAALCGGTESYDL